MKSEQEIQDKISEMMDKLRSIKDKAQHEALCNNIDALLWVIGDESGKPI